MRTVTVRDVVIGDGVPKVIVPITATDGAAVIEQARRLLPHRPDVVEWRIDHLDDLAQLFTTGQDLMALLADIPLLVTFRTAAEGGQRAIDDGDYRELLLSVAGSGIADLVDVELFRGDQLVRDVVTAAHEAGVAVVASSHDFDGTPAKEEIVGRLRRMQELGADVTKIAVMPRDPGDVLVLLDATWTMRRDFADRPLVTMAMGGTGVVSRLAGEVFGSAATFGAVGAPSAPGQVDADELRAVLDLIHRSR